MLFHRVACFYMKNKREEKEYEVYSVSKFEKYNRHRSFL